MQHVSGGTGGWVGQGSSDSLFRSVRAPRTQTRVPHHNLRPLRAAISDFRARAVTSLARFNSYSSLLAIEKAVGSAQTSYTYGFYVDHFSE